MCDSSAVEFFANVVQADEFREKRVLEVGSLYVNGSVRPIVEKIGRPSGYIGIDIKEGKFVDMVLPAEEILSKFGDEAFDAVISTEMIEHVENWRQAIDNMKSVLKAEGSIFITTRSKGFKMHGYPHDFWRFEIDDMKRIFSDFMIENLMPDPQFPGIFLRARKPQSWQRRSLEGVRLYSVILGKRTSEIPSLFDMPPLRRVWVRFFQ